jgi:hypothetical protein
LLLAQLARSFDGVLPMMADGGYQNPRNILQISLL